jgi:hypothetical protein
MKTKPKRMGEIELAQAREAARKPHRFESAHPTKWSDMVERLLGHIAALDAENDALRDGSTPEVDRT